MAVVGMDPVVVRAVGTAIQQQADQLGFIASSMQSTLGQLSATTMWNGPDAQHFTHRWSAELLPAMHAAEAALASMAEAAHRNAHEQEIASRADALADLKMFAKPFTDMISGAVQDARAILFPSGEPDPSKLTPTGYLGLAEAAYGGEADLPDGWRPLTAKERKALFITDDQLRNSANGFAATVLTNGDGKYVIAYAGTNDLQDWINNGIGATPFWVTDQSDMAASLAMQLQQSVGAENLTLTGHSLGGRLASVASIATGANAVTFNAAGVSDAEFAYALTLAGKDANQFGYVTGAVGDSLAFLSGRPWLGEAAERMFDPYRGVRGELAEGQITNYRTASDALTFAQEGSGLPNAVGKQVTVPNAPGHHDPLPAHQIDAFEGQLPGGSTAEPRPGGGGGFGGR